MNSPGSITPAAVILAGGRSSRLGPGPKALMDLGGRPLIRHVIDRLLGQADPVLISVQDPNEVWDRFGLETVADLVQRHRGPLTGLCSAMERLDHAGNAGWLLLCPCDAPFVPCDLVARLHGQAMLEDRAVAVARYGEVVQPTFSLWSQSVYPRVRETVMSEGKGGLMAMLDRLPHAVREWPEAAVPPFFNVNTAADLAEAERLLDAMVTAKRS